MTSGGGAAAQELARGVLAGEARPIGKAISEVERDSGAVPEILRYLFPHTGRLAPWVRIFTAGVCCSAAGEEDGRGIGLPRQFRDLLPVIRSERGDRSGRK